MSSAAATAARLTTATQGLPGPVAVVDLDVFDENARDLMARAAGVPVRVASKSVRVRSLVERALGHGFTGVMAYSLREALWLVGSGVRDVLIGYPTVDTEALAALAADPVARAEITLMVDDVAQARGLAVRGLMFYEAQVAGLQDSSPAVRLVKRLSMREVNARRVRILAAVQDAVGHGVELVNAGGSGSIEVSGGAPGVTEVTAGSGLFAPGLFDGYRAFDARPAAFFGLDVVREPAPGWVTAFAGGYAASGKAGAARLPRLFTPGYTLSGPEGVGEVQTPLRARRGARRGARPGARPGDGGSGAALRTGDRVWLRHAKAGEMMERFDRVHLVRGTEIVETVPTYRGESRNFG